VLLASVSYERVCGVARGSFGILLWELAARKSVVYPDEVSPFDIATVVIAGKRPAIPDSCPKVTRPA
jgi:hypothetical protein